jgi:hypothetical protein
MLFQLRAIYKTQRISRRNWLPLFYWLIDIIMVNTFLICKDQLHRINASGRMIPLITHIDFRYEIAQELLNIKELNSTHRRRTGMNCRKTTQAWYSKLFGVTSVAEASDGCRHRIEKEPTGKKFLECVRCRFEEREKGINTITDTGKRRRTKRSSLFCTKCKLLFCISCTVAITGRSVDSFGLGRAGRPKKSS